MAASQHTGLIPCRCANGGCQVGPRATRLRLVQQSDDARSASSCIAPAMAATRVSVVPVGRWTPRSSRPWSAWPRPWACPLSQLRSGRDNDSSLTGVVTATRGDFDWREGTAPRRVASFRGTSRPLYLCASSSSTIFLKTSYGWAPDKKRPLMKKPGAPFTPSAATSRSASMRANLRRSAVGLEAADIEPQLSRVLLELLRLELFLVGEE